MNQLPTQRLRLLALSGLSSLLSLSGCGSQRIASTSQLAPAAAPVPPQAPVARAQPLLIEENKQQRPLTPQDWQRLYQKTQADLKLHPKDAQQHLQLAVLLSLTRRYDDAADALERAAQLAPRDATVQSAAGLYYVRFGDMQTALRHLRRAHDLKPTDFDTIKSLAEVYEARGETAKAMNLLTGIVGKSGKNVAACQQLAGIYTELGMRPDAKREFRKILSLQPIDGLALQQLAYYAVDDGNYVEARRMLQKALTSAPQQGTLYTLMGTAYVLDQPTPENFQQAETYLQKALALGQDKDSSTHYYLGKLRQRQNKLEEASLAMEKAVALDPLNRQAQYDIAQLYTKLHRPADAKKHRQAFQRIYQAQERYSYVRQRCRSTPDDAGLQYDYAMLYLEDKAPTKALPHLQKALEIKPHWQTARQKLVALYRSIGLPRRAAEVFGGDARNPIPGPPPRGHPA